MDRRTARADQSRAALKKAFLELFQTKEPEEITVVELCRKAGLVLESGEKRGFFRLHCVARKPLERFKRI